MLAERAAASYRRSVRFRRLAWTVAAVVLATAGAAHADAGPDLTVDAASGRHAISKDIYGWELRAVPARGADRTAGRSQWWQQR
jgi:hypothetical protein